MSFFLPLFSLYSPQTHNVAAQTILDIIAVSYQNVGPPEQMLQAGVDEHAANSLSLGGGNVLIDQLKR